MMRALLAAIAISLCSLHHSTLKQDSNDGRTYLSLANAPQLITTLPQEQTTLDTLYVAPIGTIAGNLYDAGQCVWYVKNLRADIPNNWGNASDWLYNARAQGWETGSVPRVGAVGQEGNHVVLITAVNPDGTVTTTEMNEYYIPFQITSRTVPASFFTYIY